MHSITSKIVQYYKKIERTAEEVEKYFPEFKAFIDATEQEIQRPNDKMRKKQILFRQEEEKTYCKDAVYGQQRRKDTV